VLIGQERRRDPRRQGRLRHTHGTNSVTPLSEPSAQHSMGASDNPGAPRRASIMGYPMKAVFLSPHQRRQCHIDDPAVQGLRQARRRPARLVPFG